MYMKAVGLDVLQLSIRLAFLPKVKVIDFYSCFKTIFSLKQSPKCLGNYFIKKVYIGLLVLQFIRYQT